MTNKVIDLFCGAGGLSLGMTDPRFCGGFESIWAIDNDRAATQTYARNFGDHVVCGDIEREIEKRSFPNADVVVGGPPCQGFSLLNKNRNGDLRRKLWEPFMDIVEMSGAKVFLIENVRWLLSAPEFDEIAARADLMGFDIAADVLLAANYGAAQTRQRAFVLGWKRSMGFSGPVFPPLPTHKNPDSPGPSNLPPWRTVKDEISDLPDPVGTTIRDVPPPLDLHFGRTPTEVSLERYKTIPEGGNRFDLQRLRPDITPGCWIRKKSGGTDLFGRLWWNRPSVTLRTEFFKPEKGRYLHPEKHRPITHREAARLMGFPDNFKFEGSKIEIAKQIGNAVPPALAGAVGRVIRELLEASHAPTDSARKSSKDLQAAE